MNLRSNLKRIQIKSDYYEKRSGTSGISGQLYETKLLSLILLRALYDDNVKQFVLGTNIDGLGAFDDIVLRYSTNNSKKDKVIFIQAKHRDDPNKNMLTVDDIKKQNDDFSLQKYLDSYLKIKNKFITDKHNRLYENSTKNLECVFVIYTSAREQFDKKKISQNDEASLINSSENGKIFQYLYDNQDVEDLVSAIVKTRATQLAKTFSNFILKDHFENMMSDDLIKTYHVFLAQNIIKIESTTTEDSYDVKSKLQSYCTGTFQMSFWTTEDVNLIHMRRAISKELAEMKGLTSLDQNEVENLMKSLTFKLPVNFGNIFFQFNGSEKKQQRRLDYVCSIFHKLLSSCTVKTDLKYVCVKVDDNSLGPDKIVNRNDFENYRLGGLVGNLLVKDEETELLKFNLDEQKLSNDSILIIQRLKRYFDLGQFRFDINVHNFPKLTLNDKENDRQLVKDFLNKLKFYTNQAKEDVVENLVIKEIDKLFKARQKPRDSFLDIKCDAIFLKVHDKIQKWWKQPKSASYLSEVCTFYEQAEQEILHSQVLNIIHFTYCNQIKNNFVEFEKNSIRYLRLDSFLSSDVRTMIVASDEITFTSKKVIQHFDEIGNIGGYIFLDLDFLITGNCSEIITSELESSIATLLVMINRSCRDTNKFNQVITDVMSVFNGKVLIITPTDFEGYLSIMSPEIHFLQDNKNKFSNISSKLRKQIRDERKVIFQGVEVQVGAVFDSASLELFSSNLLHKLIRGEQVVIGKTLLNTSPDKNIDYYVKQNVCKYITLNYKRIVELKKQNEVCFITDDDIGRVPDGIKDIILKTNSRHIFEESCKRHNETNIHWFTSTCEQSDMIWKQSHGTLDNIRSLLDRGSHNDFTLEIKSLKDIDEKVVIISAEPGMGKSTLLTRLAVKSKYENPILWILKLDLLEFTEQYDEWKKYKTTIDLKEAMAFLYSTVNYNFKRNNSFHEDKYSNLVIEKYFFGVDLSEIKLFNYFYNNNNLAILCDGFDEICPDYINEVLQLLSTFKISKVAYLWITSRRYNVLDLLESTLGTFSFQLNPFTESEQVQYLQKSWSSKLDHSKKLGTSNGAYVEEFYYTVIIHDIKDIGTNFLGVPLHLYMITNIYEPLYRVYADRMSIMRTPRDDNYTKNFEDTPVVYSRTHQIALYEEFTNTKFYKIRFGDKKHSFSFIDPDMRKMLENEHKLFVRNHKMAAAYLLFDKNIIFSEYDIEDVLIFFENIKQGEEKTGIIESITDGKPKFVHFTFAEYFAAEFILDKLKSSKYGYTVVKYFLDNILIGVKHGVRRFINWKIQRDLNIMSGIKCHERHMKTVSDTLQAQGKGKEPTTAIDVAVSDNLEFIFMYLLDCLKSHLTEKNLLGFIELISYGENAAFSTALLQSKLSFVKPILALISGIDCYKVRDLFSSPNGEFDMFYVFSNKELTNIVLNSVQHNCEVIVDFFTRLQPYHPDITNEVLPQSAAHYLARNGLALTHCWDFLLNLRIEHRIKIFSVIDFEGQLPAHEAAKINDYNFFYLMDELLGKEEFKTMCKTVDIYGFTPICRFAYIKISNVKLKMILDKVYEESELDVADYVFKKTPKLYPKYLPDSFINSEFRFTEEYKQMRPVMVGIAHCRDEMRQLIAG